jgi:NAD(P)-dependent dehydrogenase (short-subunit alcohol dehydrogenase family)
MSRDLELTELPTTKSPAAREKVAVVTGGGRGLGRYIAKQLAAAGSMTALIGRDAAELEKTAYEINDAGGTALALPCDIRRADDVLETVQQIRDKLGVIDLLVNNAGIGGPINSVWNSDPSDWWDTFETNVFGSFMFMNRVVPEMIKKKSGIVVNIVSHAGVTRWPYCSAYSVSKSALIKLTENLAAETKNDNVSVFAFHPGLLSIGIGRDSLSVKHDKNSPLEQMDEWFREQVAKGQVIDVSRSLAAFEKLTSGNYHELSGCYIAFDDNLDSLVQAKSKSYSRSEFHRLRLNRT